MRAVIIGAGIGGLTTASALRQAGVKTKVFERAGELQESGAGITLGQRDKGAREAGHSRCGAGGRGGAGYGR